jgi:hypothetical protein
MTFEQFDALPEGTDVIDDLGEIGRVVRGPLTKKNIIRWDDGYVSLPNQRNWEVQKVRVVGT